MRNKFALIGILMLLVIIIVPTTYAVKPNLVERSCSDGWDKPCSNIYDGNENTYAQDDYNREVSYYYVTYHKPRGRTIDFEWTVLDSQGEETFNLKDTSCWNKKEIQLRATHMKYTGRWQCYNGDSWVTLREFIGYELFEESGSWILKTDSSRRFFRNILGN